MLTVRPEVSYSEDLRIFLPDVFVFGYLFPHANVSGETSDEAFALARIIWSTCVSRILAPERELVLISLKNTLRDIIVDVDSRIT